MFPLRRDLGGDREKCKREEFQVTGRCSVNDRGRWRVHVHSAPSLSAIAASSLAGLLLAPGQTLLRGSFLAWLLAPCWLPALGQLLCSLWIGLGGSCTSLDLKWISSCHPLPLPVVCFSALGDFSVDGSPRLCWDKMVLVTIVSQCLSCRMIDTLG